MRRLTIVDLSFCETEIIDDTQVLGGTGTTITVSTLDGAWSDSYDAAKLTGYNASYYIDPVTGKITTQITGIAEGSVAGAVAGVISVGSFKSVYSSSSAKV